MKKWLSNIDDVMNLIQSEDCSDSTTLSLEAEPVASVILYFKGDIEVDSLELRRGAGQKYTPKLESLL